MSNLSLNSTSARGGGSGGGAGGSSNRAAPHASSLENLPPPRAEPAAIASPPRDEAIADLQAQVADLREHLRASEEATRAALAEVVRQALAEQGAQHRVNAPPNRLSSGMSHSANNIVRSASGGGGGGGDDDDEDYEDDYTNDGSIRDDASSHGLRSLADSDSSTVRVLSRGSERKKILEYYDDRFLDLQDIVQRLVTTSTTATSGLPVISISGCIYYIRFDLKKHAHNIFSPAVVKRVLGSTFAPAGTEAIRTESINIMCQSFGDLKRFLDGQGEEQSAICKALAGTDVNSIFDTNDVNTCLRTLNSFLETNFLIIQGEVKAATMHGRLHITSFGLVFFFFLKVWNVAMAKQDLTVLLYEHSLFAEWEKYKHLASDSALQQPDILRNTMILLGYQCEVCKKFGVCNSWCYYCNKDLLQKTKAAGGGGGSTKAVIKDVAHFQQWLAGQLGQGAAPNQNNMRDQYRKQFAKDPKLIGPPAPTAAKTPSSSSASTNPYAALAQDQSIISPRPVRRSGASRRS